MSMPRFETKVLKRKINPLVTVCPIMLCDPITKKLRTNFQLSI